MDNGMNTEIKVKHTPKDDRAVYSLHLPMPIHLKEDLNFELALMHKYGIITVLSFSKYASPIFAQRKHNGKLRLLVDLRKIKTLIAGDYTTNNHPVRILSDSAQHLAGKSLFCKFDCSQNYENLQITAQRVFRWKCLNSFLLAEPLPTTDLHKVSADLCLLFQASCVSTWTQLLKLTNVLNTWTILELQPIKLQILPGTFGQSFSALA